MSWAKLDDGMMDNPKILSVGPIGLALHVAGIVWCARNLTDGFIPLDKVGTLLELRGTFANVGNPTGRWDGDDVKGGAETPDALNVALKLVETGLWEDDPPTGGFRVHDYLDYNPSKSFVLARRASGRDRKARSRASQGVSRCDSAVTPRGIPGTGTGTGVPVPSRSRSTRNPPLQLQIQDGGGAGNGTRQEAGRGGKQGQRKVRRVATEWPDDFALTDELRQFALDGGLNPEATFAHFRDNRKAAGATYYDWPAGFRTWCRNAVEFRERGRRA